MKKNRLTKVLSLFGLMLVSSIMVFTLSSKTNDDFGDDGPPCEDLEGDAAQIRIEVDQFDGSFNLFRNQSHQFFIPNDDIRNNSSDPAPFITNTDQFYCEVTVTSPQCEDWEWIRVFAPENQSNGNTMDIQVPPDGFDARIDVSYYEIADFSTTPVDFNVDNIFQPDGTRVVYEGTLLVPSLGTVPTPIFLFAVDTDFQGIDIDCDFCDIDDPWDITKGTLGGILEDHGSINNFLDNRQ